MSDYRRLISYIYEYEGKEKGKNIGFVKLETRNEQCRLYVNAKRVYVGGNAIGVYLLGQKEEKTFLGNMFVRNGCGEFRTIVDVKNVEGSGNALDTYFGLAVHDVKDSWRSYQTIWDDEMADESEKDSVVQPSTEELQAAELEDPEVLNFLQETEQSASDPEERWQQIRKEYPKVQPFDYEGDNEVLAIRPDDIGKLPRENWIYGNNSFLLHGYYNYRYLLLIRLKPEDGPVRYLLGVPGHYYSNEKYMANMFGFPNFVLSKKQPPNDGRFGYWYTDIKLG